MWLLAALPTSTFADGYSMFSNHKELKGQAVIEAGDVEKIDPPFGKIGAGEVLMLGTNCFEPMGAIGTWGFSKKAGLLLVDRSRNIRLALLESSIGSIKIDIVSVMQVSCPTSGSDDLPHDPQQRLRELKRRQDLLQRELERLRQQNQ
ncbi:MAG: hypothetical protein PHG89_11325 [Gallionella sp.]|nr:hypothetical protein [Gallionella sp.]